MRESFLREYFRNCPPPLLRKVDGSINPDWSRFKGFVEDRHVSQKEIDEEIAHDDRIIDEMLGLLPTPQYPLPEDKERTFHER